MNDNSRSVLFSAQSVNQVIQQSLRVLGLLTLLSCDVAGQAADGASEYLGNTQRTGYTDATVPAHPVLRWTYKERHPPRQSWPDPRHEVQFIDFDYADQVTVGTGMVFFGSSADHTLRALDVLNGEEEWTFYTEGPVRFAPVLYKDRAYAVSDDGHLYCLKAVEGSLIWKLRLAPGNEQSIGNEQMVSKWPCRSGVLVEGDRLYATAGMWSGDGVLIYCLNANTGRVIWKNDTTGYRWMRLPHGVGYGGVAPQGYLAFYRDTLYVAAGRAAPAIFDAESGDLLHHEIGRGYKAHYPGGSWIMAFHDWIVYKRRRVHKDADVRTGEREHRGESGLIMNHYRTGEPQMALTEKPLGAVIGDDMILAGEGPVIRINIKKMRDKYEVLKNSGVKQFKNATPPYMAPTPLAEWKTDIGRVYSLMIAGNTVIAGGRDVVTLLTADNGQATWRRKVNGNVFGITVSDGQFIVTTTAGYFYCFGKGASDSTEVVTHEPSAPIPLADEIAAGERVIRDLGLDEGYCLMLGAGDGSILFELLRKTKLVVYCLEPDSPRRKEMQRRLDEAGLLGIRAQLHSGSFDRITYAPYVANCILWGSRLGSPAEEIDFKGLYRSLRPWGGVAYEYGDTSVAAASLDRLATAGVPRQEIVHGSFGSVVERGPLPGAGEWTRGHADIGNTLSSGDEVVELPLGILWWGGVGPGRIVSRHWRAPVPLFSKGHMFIQGQHDVIGVDAYTGREMWNRHIEGVGRFPPTCRGGNIITDGDRVYCVQGLTCYALDAKTGKTVQRYEHILSPKQKSETEKLFPLFQAPVGKRRRIPVRRPSIVWEFLGIAGNRLIGTLSVEGKKGSSGFGAPFPSPSRFIFAYDTESGEKAWEITLEKTVTPTAIVSDDSRLYFLDRTEENDYQRMRRRGDFEEFSSSLEAVRISDGAAVWRNNHIDPLRKTLLLKSGVVVASANFNENRTDMNAGLSAFRAADGRLLWNMDDPGRITRSRRGGPVRKIFIVDDTLYIPRAIELRTGKEKLVYKEPLTGAPARFRLSGQNFCGNVAAGKHLLAFRSSGLGFRSLADNSPNYWLPEKRTSCWISLLPVGGIVLAPEGASTCVCSYNYKTSLALVPVKRHESWGVYLTGSELPQGGGLEPKEGGKRRRVAPVPFTRLNLNLNAPGDQYDKSGGGPFVAWPQATYFTPKFPMLHVPVEGAEEADGFRFNADFTPIAGTARPWIYASGLTGEIELRIACRPIEEKIYRMVLHFMEPEKVEEGGRVFDVLLDGKTVLSRVDIAAETGGPNRALVKEVKKTTPSGTTEISLKSVAGKPPLLCGIELIAE